MPFKSKQQEKWMWATHPQMAKQWEAVTPKNKPLPATVNSSKTKDKK